MKKITMSLLINKFNLKNQKINNENQSKKIKITLIPLI